MITINFLIYFFIYLFILNRTTLERSAAQCLLNSPILKLNNNFINYFLRFNINRKFTSLKCIEPILLNAVKIVKPKFLQVFSVIT